jgi:hypothetical protein
LLTTADRCREKGFARAVPHLAALTQPLDVFRM